MFKKWKMYTVVNVDNGHVMNVRGNYNLRPHFQVWEFACSDGSGVVLYSGQTLDWCEEIRVKVGKPTKVLSGHRTYDYNLNVVYKNDKVKHPNSKHCFGIATDLRLPNNISIDEFYNMCDNLVGNDGGVGKYNTFCHIDHRGTWARW